MAPDALAARPGPARGRGGPRLSGVWPLAAYLALLVALFVRFRDPAAAPVHRRLVASPADLRLVRRYHRVFYAVLAAAPLEWALRGLPAGWAQLAGALLFLAGVIGYRHAGRALGPQLSPLLAPAEPAALVDAGPYTHVRHPMYRAELAMAFGAPLLLGAFATLALSTVFAALVVHRVGVEEQALAERLPQYRDYVARTNRLIPRVY